MLIDWFTVAAQVVNFLVLVWLLKRFLYKPILSAIDAREIGIAGRIADAETKKNEAQQERDNFQQKTAAFEQQREALLAKAAEDAYAEQGRLLEGVRKDADAARSIWQDALRNEQHSLGEEIVRRTRLGVFDIARRTLAELAAADLEECMSAVFISRLRGLSAAEKEPFAAALAASSQSALVRSTFKLPPAQQAAIESAVREHFAVPPANTWEIRFEAAPDLISGIELTANGCKVAWNIADSLTSLEKSVDDLLEEKTSGMAWSVSP